MAPLRNAQQGVGPLPETQRRFGKTKTLASNFGAKHHGLRDPYFAVALPLVSGISSLDVKRKVKPVGENSASPRTSRGKRSGRRQTKFA